MTTTHPKPVLCHRHRPACGGVALAALVAVMVTSAAAPGPAAAAEIYRSVDEDGNVVFTDVPPRPGEAAEKVELSGGTTFTPPPGETPTETRLRWSAASSGDEAAEAAAAAVYETVEVVSPGNEEAVRENSGNLTIAARIVPNLRPGHRVQLEMDGEIVQTSQTPSFQLQHVDRGTHQIRVHVLDQGGTIVRSSDPSTFHLLRYSKLTAPNRPGGAAGG